MVTGVPVVCKQSDVFSFGCVAYELATGIKLFERDYDLFEYMNTRHKPQFPALEMDQIRQILLSQLVYALLKVDWWKRPSTEDILSGFETISPKSSAVAPGTLRSEIPNHLWEALQILFMSPRDENADMGQLVWKPHWYISSYILHLQKIVRSVCYQLHSSRQCNGTKTCVTQASRHSGVVVKHGRSVLHAGNLLFNFE